MLLSRLDRGGIGNGLLENDTLDRCSRSSILSLIRFHGTTSLLRHLRGSTPKIVLHHEERRELEVV